MAKQWRPIAGTACLTHCYFGARRRAGGPEPARSRGDGSSAGETASTSPTETIMPTVPSSPLKKSSPGR